MKLAKYCCLVFLLIIFTGCHHSKSSQKDKNNSPELTAEQLYIKAINSLNKNKYSESIKLFGQISQEYPYSNLATKSQLMEAYSYFLKRDYTMSIASLNNFITFHPGYPHIAYAYYLRMLCYYTQITDVSKDQYVTDQAASMINELIRRFPDTKYAQDARIKLDLVNDHLAGKEMEIGRFYLHRGDLIAAINRFRNVIENYQTTIHIQEALYRTVEISLSLEMFKEAQHNASVLGHNYPNSKWYVYSYNLLKNRTKHQKHNVN